jgi:hypothetical protein
LTIPPSSLLISADLTGAKDFVELEIAGIFRFSLGQCSHSSTDSDSPAYAVFSDCDSANPDRAIPWRRNRSWETTRIGGTMRVVPAHAALGSPAPRASRTKRNIAHGGHGSPSVRIPASALPERFCKSLKALRKSSVPTLNSNIFQPIKQRRSSPNRLHSPTPFPSCFVAGT